MPKTKSKRLMLRNILIIVAVVGFAILLYANRETLHDTWEVLLNANIKYIALLPLIQILNYFFVGEYYRRMFGIFGSKLSRARSWGVVAAMNFVNQILPSGGLSGISYLAYGFRAQVDIGKTTLVQFGRYIYAFTAYSLLVPVALIILLVQDQTTEFQGVIDEARGNTVALVVMLLFLAMIVTTFIFLVKPELTHQTGRQFRKALAWFKKTILHNDEPVELHFLRKMHHEFRDGISFLVKHRRKAFMPLLFMISSALCELLIVNVALIAVGVHVSVGVVFIGFVAANIVGVISVIPGDVGVHEATMLIVLTAFGVPEAATLSAILLYRVFNKVIFLPIGFYFYTNLLKPAEAAK